MGHRSKQRILSEGNSNGCKRLKEMFNSLSHQVIANQNYLEIHSYTSHSGTSDGYALDLAGATKSLLWVSHHGQVSSTNCGWLHLPISTGH